jgi:hypothetical protein
MKNKYEFVPIRISKSEAEKILRQKIDTHTWTVFNEFIGQKCQPAHFLEKWWTYWHRQLNAA